MEYQIEKDITWNDFFTACDIVFFNNDNLSYYIKTQLKENRIASFYDFIQDPTTQIITGLSYFLVVPNHNNSYVDYLKLDFSKISEIHAIEKYAVETDERLAFLIERLYTKDNLTFEEIVDLFKL